MKNWFDLMQAMKTKVLKYTLSVHYVSGTRAFKVGGGGAKFFLLTWALEKHAVHNVVTSINNSLMQSENWQVQNCFSRSISVIIQVQNCFSRSISVIISNKVLHISARRSRGALYALPVGCPRRILGSQRIFRFYIASNLSKTVKNIIW